MYRVYSSRDSLGLFKGISFLLSAISRSRDDNLMWNHKFTQIWFIEIFIMFAVKQFCMAMKNCYRLVYLREQFVQICYFFNLIYDSPMMMSCYLWTKYIYRLDVFFLLSFLQYQFSLYNIPSTIMVHKSRVHYQGKR